MTIEPGRSGNGDRFDTRGCKNTMKAVVTTGNGGYDKLEYRDVPVPALGPGEVLLQVLAAGVNNTEINTRLGWYSSSVTGSTDDTADVQQSNAEQKSDGGWNAKTPFPLIQGTDCCGIVVAAGGEEGLRQLWDVLKSETSITLAQIGETTLERKSR